MNAALDSPLEALAFNYLTYGFLTAVNNIWAWIAVVTAAVSFWRMRALPSTAAESTSRNRDAEPTTTSAAPPLVAKTAAAEPPKASCGVLEREGSTKMKFSLYYKEEEEEEEVEDFRGEDDGGDDEDCDDGAAVMSRELDAWRGGWEGMVAVRMGDMGWYRWQDRTVLDGSVVRLWEGRRRKHAAAQVVGGGAAW